MGVNEDLVNEIAKILVSKELINPDHYIEQELRTLLSSLLEGFDRESEVIK